MRLIKFVISNRKRLSARSARKKRKRPVKPSVSRRKRKSVPPKRKPNASVRLLRRSSVSVKMPRLKRLVSRLNSRQQARTKSNNWPKSVLPPKAV